VSFVLVSILKKCAFMVYFGLVIGFIISKEGKFHDLKKIHVVLNMHIPINLA